MKFHALVVDDSEDILEDVKDRLEVLAHTCDLVTCLKDAREHLSENSYSYVLLDLQIPVRYGKPSRIQNGQILIGEIRSTKGYEHTPIIVMTSHGHDSPDLAIEVMRGGGAIDYVKKPFPDSGHTLEKAVQDALAASGRSRPGAATRSGAHKQEPPQPFEAGEMVFWPTRVELCEVKVCGDTDSGMIRRILEILREKSERGSYKGYSGDELAGKVGCDGGQNGVAGAVRDFRRHVIEVLRDEANIACGLRDVIQSGGRGYRLTRKITVLDADDPQNEPVHERVHDLVHDGLNERQEWIIEQLQAGRELRLQHGVERFGCSSSTAKRDLVALRQRGLIAFDGAPRTGVWRHRK